MSDEIEQGLVTDEVEIKRYLLNHFVVSMGLIKKHYENDDLDAQTSLVEIFKQVSKLFDSLGYHDVLTVDDKFIQVLLNDIFPPQKKFFGFAKIEDRNYAIGALVEGLRLCGMSIERSKQMITHMMGFSYKSRTVGIAYEEYFSQSHSDNENFFSLTRHLEKTGLDILTLISNCDEEYPDPNCIAYKALLQEMRSLHRV